jgi:hypothetical protein
MKTTPILVRCKYFTIGWVDIGTRTKVPVPLKFGTYLSKETKITKKIVLTE